MSNVTLGDILKSHNNGAVINDLTTLDSSDDDYLEEIFETFKNRITTQILSGNDTVTVISSYFRGYDVMDNLSFYESGMPIIHPDNEFNYIWLYFNKWLSVNGLIIFEAKPHEDGVELVIVPSSNT